MPQMKAGANYYTATQAKQVLGITHGMLYHYVRSGNLHPVIPPGKKQGVYSKKEVDKLALALQAFFANQDAKVPSKLEQAKDEDLPEIVAISNRIFGDGPNVPSLQARSEWLRKNPDTFYVLRNEGKIVGYISILPLTDQKIQKLITEEERAKDVTYNDVLEFKPQIPIHIYIMAIAIDPRLPAKDKHTYGARLIRGLMDMFVELGRRGVEIKTITARSYKPDGIRLLRKMGFPELRSPIADTRLFVMDTMESGTPLMGRYREALSEGRDKIR